MFNWDDQELANIWGETNVSDDGVVPYSGETDKKYLPDNGDNDLKKLNEEDVNRKASVLNTYANNSFSDGHQQEINGGHASSEVTIDRQSDFPSFATSKRDNNAIAKKNRLDVAPVISPNQHEDKELGELVGNNWANIGSFDDFDRIFSNDDLDGHNDLGSTDVFWSSSKDITSGASKSYSQDLSSMSWEFGPLGSTPAHFEINPEYPHNENLSSAIPSHQKTDGSSSYCERNIGRCVQQEEYDLGTTCLVKEKGNLSKKKPKRVQGIDQITDSKLLHDTYEAWPSSAMDVSQSDSKGISNAYAVPFEPENFSHQHHQAIQRPNSANDEYQSCPGDAVSLNKSVEICTKLVNMTPQEKIEKLRRRQQMRAMLAIRKQQKQLGHKPASVDYIFSPKTVPENQVTYLEKGFDADDSLNTFPCYDPGSPNKRDDSSAISDIDDISAEDTVFYQLQDVVAKLDFEMRLSLRDSLYRLAQSAMQRSCSSDTSSTNRTSTYESDVANEEMSDHDRFSGRSNVETATNQIDRVVAHLLFHQSTKLPVRHVESPEPSTSTKVSGEKETDVPNSLLVGFPSKSPKSEYNLSQNGSKSSHSFMDSGDENTSNQKMAEHTK